MKYDVVVVGAGPAGTVSAMVLAREGYDVLLIDKDKLPREKTCGGAFPPRIADLAPFKNRTHQFFDGVSYKGRMYSPSLREVADYSPKDGKIFTYFAKRLNFDEKLQDMARDAGSEILEKSTVKSVTTNSERAKLTLKNGKELTCEIVVGASGVGDNAAKYVRKREGLGPWDPSEYGLALAKEYQLDENYVEEYYGSERCSLIHLKPHNYVGYAWSFPKTNSINIGYGFWNLQDTKNISVNKAFNDYITLLKKQKRLRDDFRMGKVKAALIPMKGPLKRTFTERIILVGDAAHFVSPLSGEGVYFAVDSANLAAEVISNALSTENCTATHLMRYQTLWKARWGNSMRMARFISNHFYKNSERLVRYARKDAKIVEISDGLFSAIFTYKMIGKCTLRILRDCIHYDIMKK